MAVYFAQQSANIDAVNMWNTQANGSGSYLNWPPAQGDVLMANGKTITVNVSVDLGSMGEVRNSNANGAAAGGYFEILNGVEITANQYAGSASNACIRFNQPFPASATISGNGYGGSATNAAVIRNDSSGSLNINGTYIGGSGTNSFGIHNASSGSITMNGSPLGGATGHGLYNASLGQITINGNPTGGSGSSVFGVANISAGQVVINGVSTGGSGYNSFGTNNNASGLVTINGGVVNGGGTNNAPGLNNGGSTAVRLNGNSYMGANGHAAFTGAVRFSPTSRLYVKDYNQVELTMAVTDTPADYLPATRDVRAGVAYAFGLMTGSCNVPPAQSVLSGVPVDATTGTALLAAEDIRAAIGMASANLDSQFSGIAGAIRTELSPELDNLDEPISAAKSLTTETLEAIIAAMPDGLSAADVWGHVSRSLTEAPDVPTTEEIAGAVRNELADELSRVSNCATVASTGAQLAALV